MSVILKPRPVSPSGMTVAARPRNSRNLAALATAGAAILALVLATTIPARADSKDDLAKALIAALVIGAIVHELGDGDKPLPVKHKKVPLACAISIDGSDRAVTLYAESCLKDHGLKSLPRDCSNRATIFGERDRVFSAQCLRSAGFKLSDH